MERLQLQEDFHQEENKGILLIPSPELLLSSITCFLLTLSTELIPVFAY